MKKKMAILLSLILIVVCCACGNKKTKLTLDNYSKYLSVSAGVYPPGFDTNDSARFPGGVPLTDGSLTFYLYRHLNTYARVDGLSTNFNYNDVVVTVRVDETFRTYDTKKKEWSSDKPISEKYTVACDIAGNGKIVGNISEAGGSIANMHEDMATYEWEVVDISGTVSPAY